MVPSSLWLYATMGSVWQIFVRLQMIVNYPHPIGVRYKRKLMSVFLKVFLSSLNVLVNKMVCFPEWFILVQDTNVSFKTIRVDKASPDSP